LAPTEPFTGAIPRRDDVKQQRQVHIAPGVELIISYQQAGDLCRQIGDAVDPL